jgi:predicted acyl esterase
VPSAFQRLPLAALAFVACRPTAEAPPRAPVCVAEALAPAPTTSAASSSPGAAGLPEFIAANYTKQEVQIPMRDGVTLHTAIYAPKDSARTYPILMLRTPYSCRPYGEDQLPNRLGPSAPFAAAGYIFVCQDVRGAYMSGGEFVDVRPHNPAKAGPAGHRRVERHLRHHRPGCSRHPAGHNGRVGLYGISYPGFYAAAGMIDAHPALRAVSPQAPIADWFFDDFHHHGAFFLPHTFNFYRLRSGNPRPPKTRLEPDGFALHGTEDGYQFFLDVGPLANLERRHPQGPDRLLERGVAHPNYDEFWQARDLLPHLKNVAPAVLTVGGWFDPEDLYGPLHIYAAVERQNPGIDNLLVMGPWGHGGWSRSAGDRLGDITFDSKTSVHYQQHIELPFFEHHLKDARPTPCPRPACSRPAPTAGAASRSGRRRAGRAPCTSAPVRPSATPRRSARAGLRRVHQRPEQAGARSPRTSRSACPEYMTEDQRFAARRPDVLVYQTPPLTEDLTVAGPISAELWVSTTAGDADWIVKLIDVLPPNAETPRARAAASSSAATR